jgi:pimeloyl-ACP methyl ester carboxylesterase
MRKVRAFNIRGLGRFPSNGMVKLTSLLNEIPGVSATTDDHGIFGFEYVANLTAACIAAHKSGRLIALNGHSFGANAAIMIATRLAERDIAVDYLAAIDPAAQFALSVPLNVRRIYNPYQKVDPVGRGVVKPADGESEDHWNARAGIERRNQLHVRIDDDPLIHRNIIAAIKALTA